MSSKPFSVRRAIDNDFNLTAALLVPLIMWFIYLLTVLVAGGIIWVLAVAVAATVIGPGVLIYRLRVMRNSFNQGVDTNGELVKVFFYQDRGRIDYTYTYGAQKYSSSIAIHKNNLTREFTVGQQVVVVVDPNQPEHSFLSELYS